MRDAVDDICEIIAHLYKIILENYNKDIREKKRFKTFSLLYDTMNSNNNVKKRVNKMLGKFGITSKDIDLMVEYKRNRNHMVHKYKWVPLKTQQTEHAEQVKKATKEAINRLNVASDHTAIQMNAQLKSSLKNFIEKLYAK
jgi:hypothetical protein